MSFWSFPAVERDECGNDVTECTGLIDGVGRIKSQPDGTAMTEYDVRVPDLPQRYLVKP